jgi:potassium/hydrogen antiporter
MIQVDVFFMAAGLVIFLGFFSLRFFERTKIPDILILIFTGILIANYGLSLVDRSIFITFAPYVGALALMMILFEGGIDLKFSRVVQELPRATFFTLSVFALSCLMTMILMVSVFGWSPLQALLLGSVLGGTSSAIVLSLVSKLYLDDCYKIMLTLESTITDALCIITALTIVGVLVSGSADLRDLANSLFSAFTIAAFASFIMGILWIRVLSRFHKMPFGYLLTVGVIFVLYSITEYSKGSGAIASFVFGLILGNSSEIARALKIDSNFILDESIKSFHEEASFFIRTFFFVYLGMLFDPNILNDSVIVKSLLVLTALFAARYVPVFFLMRNAQNGNNSRTLIATVMPRGLAAAVLATDPRISQVTPAGFTDIVILIIISTNIIATIGGFIQEQKHRKTEKEKAGFVEYEVLEHK